MNNYTTVIASFVLVALGVIPFASAQDVSWADKMFEVRSHDFGVVAKGTKAEFRFVFTNPYVESVHISSATSSCTCTSVFVENSTVPTYATSAIVARFDTVGKSGPNAATITVSIDKPYRRDVLLNVRGFIRSDVTLTPKSVYFGIVPEGQGGTRTVDVVYSGNSSAWNIVGIESSRGDISARVVEVTPMPASRQVRLKLAVALAPNAPMGTFSERLTIRTNEPASMQSQFTIVVEGAVHGSVSVSPPVLFLGSIRPGERVTKSIVLSGITPFAVESLVSTSDGVSFDIPALSPREARSVWIVAVHCDMPPNAAVGSHRSTVTVKTSDTKTSPTFETLAIVLPPPMNVPRENTE
ncbi:MAG: DUF1573 domain-containing protein [Thermoguttaceae bacterium]